MVYYFRFKIPVMPDGKPVQYSPGWCGTRDHCAQNEVGLLYNDKKLWGIGQAEGDYVPDDVEVLDEKQANSLISQAINQLTADTTWKPIFFADGLIPEDKEYAMNLIRNRWSDEVKLLEEVDTPQTEATPSKAIFCPTCHTFIMWLPTNILAATINLTCAMGHKVALNGK